MKYSGLISSPPISRSKPFLFALFFAIISAFSRPSRSQSLDDRLRNECMRNECAQSLYRCGELQNVYFPFYGGKTPKDCGHPGFELRCERNESSFITINELEFRVLNITQESYTMKLARRDLLDSPCSPKIQNTTLNSSFFAYPTTVRNLTLLYHCPKPGNLPNLRLPTFSCPEDSDQASFYVDDALLRNSGVSTEFHECEGGIVQVPVYGTFMDSIERNSGGGIDNLKEALTEGFDVKYINLLACPQCQKSGGKCGLTATVSFLCSCPEVSQSSSICVPRHGTRNWKARAFIGIFVGAISVLLACILMCCYRKAWPPRFLLKRTKKDQDIEAFIRSNGQLAVKSYRFSDVKKMTKSFEDKLGQGGYGEVYRGKLPDGRLVAVKLLKSSKGNGEEFVNEVASIIRTSHVNIVTLMGFCLEGSKRALIYEFMPNGSLEKFVYNENASHTNPNLEWEKLLQIATGMARGLEYLHRGCNTRILHLDIKPHNILLDEDFCPKISDFGLSKLCPKKESIVSLMEARGTIGYVAPEVFNRNFGGVSSKSDVYSYGMMILEVVGGRKNIKVDVTHTSEIYFPDWIYKHLELGDNLQLWSGMTSEDNGMARKMIIVGLWCIQTNPSDRPSMSKVTEMLEGNLDALNIRPKPTFSSPRSPEQFPAELATESSTSSLL